MLATTLEFARSQMAFTLAFHIVLASVGVAFPAIMLIANYRGLKHDDPDALLPTNEDRAKAVVDWAGAATTHQRTGRITVERS